MDAGATKLSEGEIKRVNKTLKSPLQYIYGTYNISEYAVGNQMPMYLGLPLAHLQAWDDIVARNLPAAWIFEDDVLFHDDFDDLFPVYWGAVPADYEVVYVGHNPTAPEHLVACQEGRNTNRLFHEHPVYTTHAMVVSQAGAQRLRNAMHGLLDMAKRAKRQPAEVEISSDLFLNYVRNAFLPDADQHKWMAFDATVEHPASWGGVQWCRVPDLFENYIEVKRGKRCCEECKVADIRREFKNPIPVVGTGLAYQHWCKRDPEALLRWRID